MTEYVKVPLEVWQNFRAACNEVIGVGVISADAEEIVVTAPPRPEAHVPFDEDAAFAFTDYGRFYDFLRGNKMLGPTISKPEFEGCDRIIRACAEAQWPVSWVAYALATAYHETAHTMQPIKEMGGAAYFTRMYDIKGSRPAKARELGNLTPGDGAKYAGRGYVQLTGKANYAKATEKLLQRGINVPNLTEVPDRVMEPAIAAAILVIGIADGWFTGRKIADDLPARGPAGRQGFILTRDTINGTDRQDMIADYAVDFQTGLQQAGYNIAT